MISNCSLQGVDVSEVVSKELTDLLDIYLNDGYRKLLLNPFNNHRFIFMKRDGQPFGDTSYFGSYLGNVLQRETGIKTNFNLLRSSLVTFMYNSEASMDQNLRESVAQAMRHSTAEARRTYDRRQPHKKKRRGLEYLAELAAGRMDE